MNETFERRVAIRGAFDRRHPDPSKNYGIHGMELRFTLIGPKGAVHFLVFTPMHLPHVAREMWEKNDRRYNPFETMGADVGYHSPTPFYEWQEPCDCDLLPGGKCYGDGSALMADEFTEKFLKGGDAVVWPMLEEKYRAWLEPAVVDA